MAKTYPILLSLGLNKNIWPKIVKIANYFIIYSPATKLSKTSYKA